MPDLRESDHDSNPRPLWPADRSQDPANHQTGPASGPCVRGGGIVRAKIRRAKDGKQLIICPRCSANSPITANNCKSCGMPFTMEGTTLEAAGANSGFCVAALVLGIIGIPTFFFVIPALLAIIFGIIGLKQIGKPEAATRGGRGMAIAGIVCGSISCLIAVFAFLRI